MREQAINYFAYASNLNTLQMEERKVSWKTKALAILQHYELVFNKRGVLYPGNAAANVVGKQGAVVEGVLYELASKDAIAQLDRFEIGYDKKEVIVMLKDSGAAKQASIYVAKPEFIVEGVLPSPEYLRRIFEGGRDVFSPEYATALKRKTAVSR